jgi:hypothetical protein
MTYDERPFQDVHYGITDEEARDFLEQLANEDSELRQRLAEEDPREVLLEYKIHIKGVSREDVKLPDAQRIKDFITNELQRPDETHNVGYAIIYFMLGAMPFVVAEGDAAP